MPDNPIILDIQGEDGFTLDMQDSDGLDFEAQPFSKGDPGKSAYQVAVDNGFSGTEEEWLASLVGPQGPPGTTDWDGITNKPYLPWEQGVDANDQPVPGAIKAKDYVFDNVTRTNSAPWTGDFVAGGDNTATGNYAVIAGRGNTANAYSTTIGDSNTAAGGGGSTLLGNGNQATSGTWGFATGVGNTISHNNTVAMGWQNTASNYNAVAMGHTNTASGYTSAALGYNNTSSGNSSLAVGYQNTASASAAHAEGRSTVASGQCAHTEGYATEASGYQSHAEGHGTQATARYNHVFGEYNISDPGFTAATARGSYIEIVGNGDDAQNRSNARTLDWDGNEVLAGTLTVGSDPTSNMEVATKQYVDNALPADLLEQGVDENDQPVPGAIKAKDFVNSSDVTRTNSAPYTGAFVVGGDNTATGNYAAIAGMGNTAYSYSVVAGRENQVTKAGAVAFGRNNIINENGSYAFTAGYGNTVTGNCAVAICDETSASGVAAFAAGSRSNAVGQCAVAIGQGNTASGIASFAEAYHTTASNLAAHAEGHTTTASGCVSHAEGWQTEASGDYSHAEGQGTQATARNNHVFGRYNISDPGFTTADARGTYVEIVGNGDDAQNRSNARTLDWTGNEVLAGKLTVGAGPTANMDVATKQYVDNATSNIPTKTSDLTNDSGFITGYTETDPVFTASAAHGISSTDISNWNGKPDDLSDLGVTATASEVNILDGATIPTADLNQAYQGIPYGNVTSNSTTVFTATVPGVTALKDGTCCLIRNNNKQTSASGWTLNVNDLGAKPVYNNMADASRETTIFNKVYTMLFVYDEDRVDGGCWICYRGYNSDNNTIGYQLRTNSTVMNVSDSARYYKLYFTSADNTMWVPAAVNSTNSATSAKTVNQRPINPFGRIVYMSASTNFPAGANLTATACWDQYALALGYSFNRTGAALTLTVEAPVYIKCAPQSDGSAIIDADTPFVQALPSTADGKIYIYLGVAYSATNVELVAHHPVYYYDGTAIRIWSGKAFATVATSGSYTDLSNKPTIPTVPTNLSAFTDDLGSSPTHTHSQYLTSYTETDPVFTASAAHGITSTDISNWNGKSDFSGDYNDLSNKPTIPTVPTNVSAFTNDAGYLTSYTETDPVFAASAAAGITSSDISDWNGKVDDLADLGITATATELNYTSGVTSNIQDQLNAKASKSTTESNLAYVESTSTASRAYSVGDYFVNSSGVLCKITAAVANGGTLTNGTNYTAIGGNGGLANDIPKFYSIKASPNTDYSFVFDSAGDCGVLFGSYSYSPGSRNIIQYITAGDSANNTGIDSIKSNSNYTLTKLIKGVTVNSANTTYLTMLVIRGRGKWS